jgi:hypothetical protein
MPAACCCQVDKEKAVSMLCGQLNLLCAKLGTWNKGDQSE